MTPAELQAIKARLEKATPGPWDVYDLGVYSTTKINPLGEATNICGDVTWEDAELIAHAPTDIAMLLGENEKLRKVAEAAQAHMECAECRGDEDCDHCVLMQALAKLEGEEMKAGYELDALVEQKVFGAEWAEIDHYLETGLVLKPKETGYLGKARVLVRDNKIIELRPFSTDIAAAWDVMERLTWAGPELSWNDEQHVWCLYLNKARPQESWPAAPTAPLAICLSALKAVEGK